MCGLAGVAGYGILPQDLQTFSELLFLSGLRGMDSTGVAAINARGKGTYDLRKEVLSSPEFVRKYSGKEEDFFYNRDRSKYFLRDSTYDLFIGHARYATTGHVTKENAHPFDTKNLIGAHNGTLVDREFNPLIEVNGKYKKDQTKTDSELMFQKMSTDGIQKVLESLHPFSAYAVSIWDKQRRRLILARNRERPLYIAFMEDAKVMFWCSDLNMLRMADERNKARLKFFRLEPDKMYVIDIAKINRGSVSPWEDIIDLKKSYILPSKEGGGKIDRASSMFNSGGDWNDWLRESSGVNENTENKSLIDEVMEDMAESRRRELDDKIPF